MKSDGLKTDLDGLDELYELVAIFDELNCLIIVKEKLIILNLISNTKLLDRFIHYVSQGL